MERRAKLREKDKEERQRRKWGKKEKDGLSLSLIFTCLLTPESGFSFFFPNY
jgi:hypothetical protein